jgi:hypothetical protein
LPKEARQQSCCHPPRGPTAGNHDRRAGQRSHPLI